MMKFANSDTTTMSLRHGEQYENCSELLIEPDMTSLEELDPAILSCGLPAIVLNEEDLAPTAPTTTTTTQKLAHPVSLMASFNVAAVATTANVIRYTVAHLLALRKSPFSHRRPAAIDDPRTALYPIWSRTGFNHHQQQQQDSRVRRVSGGCDEEQQAYGRKPNDRQRDNGFNPPRFRRNHEFSNRNHHVIVKSYSAGDGPSGHNGAMRLQDTIIEEEPEWVVGGPTSRLDTIELRGFDEDVSRTVSESLKASPPCGKQRGAFFDELLHYEHVHPKHHGGGATKHDTSGSAGDGESVSTSNNGSPPPARSTPTKDMNNNTGRKLSGMAAGCSSSGGGGVNVSNFEELMKFDSILGDSGDSTSSRFSKYYHRGNGGVASGSGSGGQQHHHHHPNHHAHSQHHVRFALERNTHHYGNAPPQHQNRQAGSGRLPMSALQHPPAGVESYIPGAAGSSSTAGLPTAGDAKSFQRLLEMLAAQNQRNYQQHQQHYLLQLLQNCQETETLRQMLLKKCSLENAATNLAGGGGQQPNQRIPTQAELQQHTQTIMKQALLRKKIAEQSRYLLEQQNGQEPIPAVQQLIQSICPNVQRSLSVLAGNGAASQHMGPDGRNDPGAVGGGAMFGGGHRGGSMRHSNRRY